LRLLRHAGLGLERRRAAKPRILPAEPIPRKQKHRGATKIRRGGVSGKRPFREGAGLSPRWRRTEL